MNFAFSSEQNALRAEARRFLGERVDVRAQMAYSGGHDPELWRELEAMGWLGELPLVEECILVDEAGRALLPGPFLQHRLDPGAPLDTPCDVVDLTRAPLRAPDTTRARTLVAADSCGVAQRALDDAVAYARQREQFGRPIGSFQAIKHTLADVLRALTAARMVTYAAAAGQGDFDVAAAVTLSNDAARAATKENIQIHGGIGVTWEHDAHLLYRRAMANSAVFADDLETAAAALFDA